MRSYCEAWEEPIPTPPKKDRLWILPVVIALVLILGLTVSWFATADARAYVGAIRQYKQGEYVLASESFAQLSGYRSADHYGVMSRWQIAEGQFAQEAYLDAIATYETLDGYENSTQRIHECYYRLGEACGRDEREQALEYFILAEDFSDAAEKRSVLRYDLGHLRFLDGDIAGAEEYFSQMETQYGLPHLTDFEQLRNYLEEATAGLETKVECFVYDMPEAYDEYTESDELWGAVENIMEFQVGDCRYYEGLRKFTAEVHYYPGQRIVYAWRTGDESVLSAQEKETYAIAQDLVAQAKVSSDEPLEQLRWIHDWICANNEYSSPDMMVTYDDFIKLTELNSIGALQTGYINCQGYTDAFYLLGTMAGFDVCRIAGSSEDVGHCWNGVTFEDTLYMVDVTFDDLGSLDEPDALTYIWFGAPWDPALYEINSPDLFPNLLTETDFSHGYYGMYDAVYEDLDDALLAMLEQHAEEGDVWTHTVVTGEEYTSRDVYNAIGRTMGKAGYRSVSWYEYLYYYGGNTYISILWT